MEYMVEENNTRHAERLMKSGDMAPTGLKEVNAAKADGRWKAAYDSFSNAHVPDDFLKALTKNKRATAFLQTLNKTKRAMRASKRLVERTR